MKKRLILNYIQHIKSLYTVRGMVHKLLSVVFHYQTNFSLFFKSTCFCILPSRGMALTAYVPSTIFANLLGDVSQILS